MFVYWGYWDSGKGHMKKYAKMNSKTVIFYDNNSMRKIETNESNTKKTTYYYDNEFISEVTRTKFNPDKRKYRLYIERESEQWRKFEQYGNESLTHDQLSGHYDTIFDRGDIFLMNHLLPEFFIVDNITRLRSSCNIVPYHTDLEHMYIPKLDYFGMNRAEEFGNNLWDIWNHDKDRIFDWLDLWEQDLYGLVNRLKKYNISYQYFDLSKDSYVDTFGWTKELHRDYSDDYSNINKKNISNIDEYKNIIRQYLQNRNLKEFQLL